MSSKDELQTGSITDESASTGRVVDRDGGGSLDRASNAGDGGSVTPSEPMPTAHKIDRRTFVKGLGVAGAAGVGLSGRSPGPAAVGEAEAIAPIVVAGGAVTVGWALREFEVIGSDSPAEGLTPEVLRTQVYNIARKRYSNNQSTIIDNGNILDGAQNVAYTEGKIAAIEQLNQEVSQSEVETAAIDAAESYMTTIQTNLLKSWDETAKEYASVYSSLDSHGDLSPGDLLSGDTFDDNRYYSGVRGAGPTQTINLIDGSTLDIATVSYQVDGGSQPFTYYTDATGGERDDYLVEMTVSTDGNSTVFFSIADWKNIYDEILSVSSTVTGGLATWVNSVYSEVQAGEIEVSDLLTPREQAAMLSDDEEYPQAVADLLALNIPVDPDREATIHLSDRDITISGLMAPTSPPADGFVVGQTYDPVAADWDLYFTYDPSKGSGGWTDFETEISEGTLVFTAEPYEASLFRVPTNAGTVEVTTSEFTESDSGGTWTAEVSDQLERVETEWTDFEAGIDGGTVTFTALPAEPAEFDITATDGDSETVTAADFTDNGDGTYSVETGLGISEVESVTARIDRWTVTEGESVSVYAEDGSTGYETIQIKESFTLEKLEDSEGNTYGQSEFSQTEPQTDTNYITQEEWDNLEQKNQELIDKYEESTESNDGLLGGGGWGDIVPGGGAGALAVGVAVSLGVLAALREGIKFYLPGR